MQRRRRATPTDCAMQPRGRATRRRGRQGFALPLRPRWPRFAPANPRSATTPGGPHWFAASPHRPRERSCRPSGTRRSAKHVSSPHHSAAGPEGKDQSHVAAWQFCWASTVRNRSAHRLLVCGAPRTAAIPLYDRRSYRVLQIRR